MLKPDTVYGADNKEIMSECLKYKKVSAANKVDKDFLVSIPQIQSTLVLVPGFDEAQKPFPVRPKTPGQPVEGDPDNFLTPELPHTKEPERCK